VALTKKEDIMQQPFNILGAINQAMNKVGGSFAPGGGKPNDLAVITALKEGLDAVIKTFGSTLDDFQKTPGLASASPTSLLNASLSLVSPTFSPTFSPLLITPQLAAILLSGGLKFVTKL
jgi:hypothetical protein